MTTQSAETIREREELRERLERWTETPLNLLGVALLAIIIVEFSADLSPAWDSALTTANWFIYAVFAISFAVQFALATSKGAYLKHNWVAAISVLMPAFRVLRALRGIRALVRSLRLVRVLTATNRGTRSVNHILRGHQFGRVLALTGAVVAVGAAALTFFEIEGGGFGSRYGDALWYAVALITTVGSEFQPSTIEGRIVTTLLIVWGLGVFGFITGSVASYFVGQDTAGSTDETGEELRSLRREVAELREMLAESQRRRH